MTQDDNARHAEKMAKRKAARDKMMASKVDNVGLIIVHTGPGKGKSTAAFGMAMRQIGHGMRVGIVQFIKGAWDTGEKVIFDAYPDQVTFKPLGEGFTWETQDKEKDIENVRKAWAVAKEMIEDETYSMVILDELNIALRYDYLDLNEVLETLKGKRDDLHVVITGRNAKDELIEAAHLVTEMTQIKHPFRSGIKAQKGVEF